MKFLTDFWQALRHDNILKRVLRNSSYLLSSNSISLGLNMVQSIFAARLLGVTELGVLAAITGFASTINRLFSFRMGDLVVKYLGNYLPEKENDRAAALVKIAAITEAASSVLAFLLLMLLAPLGARYFAKDLAYTPLFRFYGIFILGSFMAETATGVLQSTDRFNQQAIVNLGQSLLTAAIILAAFLVRGNLIMVVGAYLIGKMVLGLAPVVLAWHSMNANLGKGWWRAPLTDLPPWRELARFGISTNLSATVNMLVRDSEVLWVNLFLSPTAGGYYKVAIAIASFIPIPITPFISTTFPEISRCTAARAWKQLRGLLQKVSMISAALTAIVAVVVIFFGKYLILFYGAEFLPSYPALMVLLVGYGVSNLVFWNRPLLLALNLPVYPFWATFISGAVKVSLAFLVIPAFGYVGAAVLLTGYFLISGTAMALRGLNELKRVELSRPGETV